MKKIGGLVRLFGRPTKTGPLTELPKGAPVKGVTITEKVSIAEKVPIAEGVPVKKVPEKVSIAEGVLIAEGVPVNKETSKTLESDTCPNIERLKTQLKEIGITSFESKASEKTSTTNDMNRYAVQATN